MCRTIENYQVDRCFAINCPLDKAIVDAMQLPTWVAKAEEFEGRLDSALADWAKDSEARKNEREFIGAHLESWAKRFDRIKAELQSYADAGDLDIDESTLAQFLVDEFELEFTEEVNVTLTIEVSATVTKPKNVDVHYHDFDIDDLAISVNESGWEIELGDPEITDVTE